MNQDKMNENKNACKYFPLAYYLKEYKLTYSAPYKCHLTNYLDLNKFFVV